jgi:Fe-S-cluster containining protein
MDGAYGSVQRHYGFSCEGCADNCCTQRFYHYTQVEYLYLLEGLRQAEPDVVREIFRKAREVVEAYGLEDPRGPAPPLMCPVNVDGLCSLYEFRPMICRIHGLPHRFRRPDGREERGGGCAVFESSHQTDWRVDRTREYGALARLEGEVRRRTMRRERSRRTTAGMILAMLQSEECFSAYRE